jgi:murein DD-endopeptidase MepM/ murein hydrolase activator NlpD
VTVVPEYPTMKATIHITATPPPIIKKQSSDTFILPTEGYLMSKFGWRRHPKTGRKAFHTGIDISHWFPNIEVWASRSGTVTFSGVNQGYGITVIIKHDDHFETMYSHLKIAFPSVNDVVEQGEVIGIMGATGRTTGVHLHFELRKNRKPVNPLDYIENPSFVTR